MTESFQPAIGPTPEPAPTSPPPLRTLADICALPAIVYCTTLERAAELIREIIFDAVERCMPIALDTETMALPAEARRLQDAQIHEAALKGKLKAATKAKASADEMAALKAEEKFITARVKYLKTAALDPHRSQPRLVQAYGGGKHVAVVDVFRTGVEVLRLFEGVDVVMHHAGFDLAFFEAIGIALGAVHCTMQGAILTLGVRSSSLEDTVKAHLGVQLDKSAQTSDWSTPRLTLDQIRYAAIDAVAVWLLTQRMFSVLGAQTPAYEIAARATPAVARMKHRGLGFDLDGHAALIRALEVERVGVCEAYKSACISMDLPDLAAKVPNTPNEIRVALSAMLTSEELASWQRTAKTNALSTSRADLRRAAHYPPVMEIVALSKINKLLTGFGPTLRALVNPVTGRIHANYRVAGAASGRASCSYPNLQQVPSKKSNKDFRAAFVAALGHVFVGGDFNAMELRAAAHRSMDRRMMEAFRNGVDLHRLTASRMLSKRVDEVTDEERAYAKPINFGAIYGEGASGLVKSAWKDYQVALTEDEARKWLDAFRQAYPDFAQWRYAHADQCEAAGCIVIGRDAAIGVGRIFPFSRLSPKQSKFTTSCNYPIQGACADASMLALEAIDSMLFEEGIDGGPVLWVHDEIVLEVPKAEADRAKDLLERAMTEAFEETFPGSRELGLLNGLVEAHIGQTWAEVKDGMSKQAPRRECLHSYYEFFAGGGMARAGLGPAWTCVFANDIDTKKAASYVANWGSNELRIDDIAKLSLADLPGVATLAWASWPCTDLSLAGDRAGLAGARSGTFWPFWNLMIGMLAEGRAPRLIVLENVCGLLTSPGGRDFAAICDALAYGGYWVGAVVINAKYFVPQSRKRVFIIAAHRSCSIPNASLADGPSDLWHPSTLLRANGALSAKARDAWLWWRLPPPPIRNVTFSDLIEAEPKGVRWHTPNETARLIEMMDQVNLAKVDEAKKAGRRVVGGLYPRMRDADGQRRVQRAEIRFDDVAGCLRVPTGGSSRQTIVIVRGDDVRSRLLSSREAARLMGLPDSYALPANYNEAYHLLGDGVVAPVVRFIAEHILEPILAAPAVAPAKPNSAGAAEA